jgi:hypothetical protein
MNYTEKFRQLARLYATTDIEFPHLKAITLAQWMLESGRGSSFLAERVNNFGGMMWRKEMANWGGVGFIEYTSPSDNIKTDYITCSSLDVWIECYWLFIDRSPYKGWRGHAGSETAYIKFLKKCGYAADPDYVSKVLALLPEAEELLYSLKDDTHSEGERMPKVDIVKNSPNKSARNATITHIVLHNTAGGFGGSIDWLCNPSAKASAHLVVSRKGETAQIVPFGEKAWHAGNANPNSIGIEIEATNNQKGMTPKQEQKVIEWCWFLMGKYNIKASNIIIHRMVGNTDCPVLIWPTDADFLAWRKKNLEAIVTPPRPEPKPVEKKVTWYDVFDLDGEVGIAAMAGSEPVELLRAPTSLAMSKFLAEHGDHNVKAAPAGKKWPGAAKA